MIGEYMVLNWNNFKAKFDGREQNALENGSNPLFCEEHTTPFGIFRFKNQTGIETEPIQVGEKLVGFQAKFYDTKLSQKKNDIIDSIKKAKRENVALSVVYVYLNKEFSESRKKAKKEPQYKTDIQHEAENLKLDIVWKVPSHFEKQLALPENKYLADYYFSLEKSTLDLLKGLSAHSDNLLNAIQSNIKFKDKLIKVDRSGSVIDLVETQDPITIVSGEGGSGKTAVIKEFYDIKKRVFR
jgi:hypothetical protein